MAANCNTQNMVSNFYIFTTTYIPMPIHLIKFLKLFIYMYYIYIIQFLILSDKQIKITNINYNNY